MGKLSGKPVTPLYLKSSMVRQKVCERERGIEREGERERDKPAGIERV